jgi:hypothetical protein
VTPTAKGRARQRGLFDFLSQYHAATTDQLARLLWRGDRRLAGRHLLRFVRDGRLRRLPHPTERHGPFVYLLRDRSAHSPKIAHHLAEVDFHLAVMEQMAHVGARVIPELPWGPGSIPDQTVILRDGVWAVEHHLTGQFAHASDYRRFLEEEQYQTCEWWRPGIRIGLLVVTSLRFVDQVRFQLKLHDPPGLTWHVGTRENVLDDVRAWLK